MEVVKTMIALVRTKVRDLNVRKLHEYEILAALNEGKNELVKLMRQADENFFETTVEGTISSTTSPNYSTISLPSNFAELRNLQVTSAGLEDTIFINLSQSDNRFRQALLDHGSFANGASVLYYDFMGKDSIIVAPGLDIDMTYLMHYIRTIPDMIYPNDYPIEIPPEHIDYIVTFAICECMRTIGDERLAVYLEKLDKQEQTVIASINTRQSKEPKFVTGYMEEEFWG
jgi:hypothetical protein